MSEDRKRINSVTREAPKNPGLVYEQRKSDDALAHMYADL